MMETGQPAGVAGGGAEAPISVAVVEDDARLRDLLALLLDGTPGYACAGRYEGVEDALQRIPEPGPDVVLLDVHLPGERGSTGVKRLRAHFPRSQVVMLTVYAEDDLVFEAICNGAVGYMLKKTPPARLLEAIREARDGGAPMSPEVARRVLRLFHDGAVVPGPAGPALSPQELRFLRLLAEGHSYESAGANLDVSVNTVRKYVRSVYQKLHVHSRSEAVSKAIRAGLI